MSFCLYLIDSEQANVMKLDAKRRLRLDRLDKIFYELEVVPLFGDMQIAPFNYVKKMMHYEPGKWPLSSQNNPMSPQVSRLCCNGLLLQSSSRHNNRSTRRGQLCMLSLLQSRK
jgi:hypothetical protein